MHKHFVGDDGIGYVSLIDHMPREDLDQSVVDAARVSYDAASTKHTSTNRGLIRYLMRHWHTTPFEMVEFKFIIKMPLFIARQHFRHRTASVNEVSARYSEVKDEFFVPDELRKQAKVNRQGSEGVSSHNDMCTNAMNSQNHHSHRLYKELLESEVCREQARMVLPQAMYTEFVWKINMHNLIHYLHLRMGEGAQAEIRAYANKIYELVKPLAPYVFEAFEDFRLNSISLSGPELKFIRGEISEEDLSKGELREVREKMLLMSKDGSPRVDV